MPGAIQPLSLNMGTKRFVVWSRPHSVARLVAMKTSRDDIGRGVATAVTSRMKVFGRAFQALGLGGIDAERPRELFWRRLPHREPAVETMSGLGLVGGMTVTRQGSSHKRSF